MPSIFYQPPVNEESQIGGNSSIFVSYFYQGFLRQKYGGQSPQASRNHKISLKLVSCKSIKRKKKKKPLGTHALLSWSNWANSNFSGLLNSPGRAGADRWSSEYSLCISFSGVPVISQALLWIPSSWVWVLFSTLQSAPVVPYSGSPASSLIECETSALSSPELQNLKPEQGWPLFAASLRKRGV